MVMQRGLRADQGATPGAGVTRGRDESLPVQALISLDPRGGPPSGDHLMRRVPGRVGFTALSMVTPGNSGPNGLWFTAFA